MKKLPLVALITILTSCSNFPFFDTFAYDYKKLPIDRAEHFVNKTAPKCTEEVDKLNLSNAKEQEDKFFACVRNDGFVVKQARTVQSPYYGSVNYYEILPPKSKK
jgi:hypothetical protein